MAIYHCQILGQHKNQRFMIKKIRFFSKHHNFLNIWNFCSRFFLNLKYSSRAVDCACFRWSRATSDTPYPHCKMGEHFGASKLGVQNVFFVNCNSKNVYFHWPMHWFLIKNWFHNHWEAFGHVCLHLLYDNVLKFHRFSYWIWKTRIWGGNAGRADFKEAPLRLAEGC